jgi:hypothetical protein
VYWRMTCIFDKAIVVGVVVVLSASVGTNVLRRVGRFSLLLSVS